MKVKGRASGGGRNKERCKLGMKAASKDGVGLTHRGNIIITTISQQLEMKVGQGQSLTE